jgi:hypothetical protein
MSNVLLRAAVGCPVSKTYVEDVFSAYNYQGNNSTQTITTGIDLDTKEGMVWIKGRKDTTTHQIFDTVRGATYVLSSPDAAAASTANTDTLTAFSSTGFSLGDDGLVNFNYPYSAWTFRQSNNFFHISSQVKAVGVDKTVDLSALGTVGMIAVRRDDAGGDWYVWHRSCTAGKLLYLNLTNAEATLGYITVSGTTLTLEDGVIADGTYIVYAWAHDEGVDGLIQCGTFTTDASGDATVELGWEPQALIVKGANTTGNWFMMDTMHNWSNSVTNWTLAANLVAAEVTSTTLSWPETTGFKVLSGFTASKVYIYLTVRRGPMREPTVGTQVYNAGIRPGDGGASYLPVSFPQDLWVVTDRGASAATQVYFVLRGFDTLCSSDITVARVNLFPALVGDQLTNYMQFGTNEFSPINYTDILYVDWFFRRYPGVFDVVYYTGTGSNQNITHSLGAVPELILIKECSGTYDWAVYAGDATDYLVFSSTAATADDATYWNDTAPTKSVFTVGTNNSTSINDVLLVAFLFATLAGISKVGTYVGNGTSQTIDCGFSTGARFVMSKATSTTGSWMIGDSTRGLIAGNDPYLYFNSNITEVTGKDWLDPDNSGFIVNETTGPNANTNNVTYIYLAFA